MGPLADASLPGSTDKPAVNGRPDRVVLVGGDCVLGVALLERWEALGIAATVVGRVLDGEPGELAGHPVIDIDRRGAVAAALAGADELVVLAASGVRDVDGSGIGLVDEGLVASVLLAAVADPPAHVTVMSTALAYSPPRVREADARSRESDPLGGPRVMRRLPDAVAGRVRLERRALEWGERHGVPVAALRPVLCASLFSRGWYDRSAWRVRRLHPSPWPHVQYVHVRDVVAAAEVVRETRTSGAFNVAPDDVLDGPTTAELADRRFVVGVSGRVLVAVEWLRWLTWWSPTPPSAVKLVGRDLAVDSTGLREAGWGPTHSSAEAFLVAHAPAWWPSLSARRRQDLVLGGAASLLLGLFGGVAWALVRAWRRAARA